MKKPQSSNTLPSTVQAESCLEPLAPSMSLSVQAPSWHPMSLCPLAVSVSCLRLRLLPRAQPTAAHQALTFPQQWEFWCPGSSLLLGWNSVSLACFSRLALMRANKGSSPKDALRFQFHAVPSAPHCCEHLQVIFQILSCLFLQLVQCILARLWPL